MPIPTGSASQGILPFVGLDDELSALRDEVVRLQAENARLQRLLELTPQQARPPGPVQTGVFDGESGAGGRRLPCLRKGRLLRQPLPRAT